MDNAWGTGDGSNAEEIAKQYGMETNEVERITAWINEGKIVWDILTKANDKTNGTNLFLILLSRLGQEAATRQAKATFKPDEADERLVHPHVGMGVIELQAISTMVASESGRHQGEAEGLLVFLGTCFALMGPAQQLVKAGAESTENEDNDSGDVIAQNGQAPKPASDEKPDLTWLETDEGEGGATPPPVA